MKKLIISTLIMVLTLSLASCTKLLENPREGATEFNSFYANANGEDAEKLIAAVYNTYFGSVEGTGALTALEIISDDYGCGGGSYSDNANNYRNADELTYLPSHNLFRGNTYSQIYSIIYQSNLILDKIPESNDATVNRVKGEATFFRAVALFEAMRIWHDPPFADHIYTSEDMLAPNGDPKEMIDWVLENLDNASKMLPNLPAKGQQASIGGRATSAAALAFYGKAALWYGTQYKDNEYVKKAIAPLKKIIDSNLYGLIPNMKDLGRQKSDFCEEYIFERNAAETSLDQRRQNDNRHVWRSFQAIHVYIPTGIKGVGWAFCNPSKEFVEFMKEHDGEDNARFNAKLLSFDQLMAMDYPDEHKGMKLDAFIPNSVGYFDYQMIPWYEDAYPDTGNDFYSRANVAIIRYAEVLLMYAEAKFIADGDSDGSGLRALNQVRERAQLPAVNSLTMQVIIDERRAELFGNCERWFDIIRWGIANEVLKDAGIHRYTFYGYKPGTTEYDIRDNWEVGKIGEGHGWDDKYWNLPYGTTQLQANPNLKQHPGW